MNPRTPWIWLAAVVLSACGSMARRQSQPSLERYRHYAGPPIQRSSYRDSYDGWQAVADYQWAVFVANDAYLLSVAPPCAQLPFAQHVRLRSASSGTVSRYDYAVFDQQKCLIDEIRQVDDRRMQQDAAQQREPTQKSG
jgi:Family of unknown function (DUF6491)